MIESTIDESRKKWESVFIILVVVLILCFLLNITLGSVKIPFPFVISYFTGQANNEVVDQHPSKF